MVQMLIEDNGFVFLGDKRGTLKPGEWTDDAGQFIALMNSFNVTRGYEPLDAAGCLTGWFKHKPKRVGMHTSEIIRHLRVDLNDYEHLGKESWIRSAGVKAGNGALTRCLVPGLYYYHDLERMIESTIGISIITHWDPRCVESAVALNYILMECLNERFSRTSLEYAEGFIQSIRQSDHYRKYLDQLDYKALMDYTNFSPFMAYSDDRDGVIQGLHDLLQSKFSELHNTGYCIHSMQVAVAAVLQSENFEHGLRMAVELGGETDTNGALAGALLGATYGMSGIPSSIKSKLSKYNLIASQAEQLLNSAERTASREGTGSDGHHTPPPPIM